MSQHRELFKRRTKDLALRVINPCDALPTKASTRVICNQLLRSGTSVGANYRSACRARSPAEFCAKMGIVEEELDESLYWLELLIETQTIKRERLQPLVEEMNELLAMTVASITTARRKKAK
jgi:four helix bundle protein